VVTVLILYREWVLGYVLRVVVTERGLYPAASANWTMVSDLLRITSRMNSRVEEGRSGAIVPWCLNRGVGTTWSEVQAA
jgi:hypothetical protein